MLGAPFENINRLTPCVEQDKHDIQSLLLDSGGYVASPKIGIAALGAWMGRTEYLSRLIARFIQCLNFFYRLFPTLYIFTSFVIGRYRITILN